MPLIIHVKDLKNYFDTSAKQQGKITNIYEDPDSSIFVDKDLIRELEKESLNNP